MKLTAHCLVKNEERWIWYSLMSILDYVDEIMVWDTGSTDKTVEVIKSIDNPKIKFKQVNQQSASEFTIFRNKMLNETKSDWLMILDGDEIWPQQAIAKTTKLIKSNKIQNLEYLIHPYYDLLGDVYHYQEPSGGKYHLDKYSGHITIRFFNLSLLPGLHFGKPHGQQGIYDQNQTLVQDRTPHKYKFMDDCGYLHATHLHRSARDIDVMKRDFKFKYEWGKTFPADFEYPVSFYLPHGMNAPTAWKQAGLFYWLNSFWQTPLKWLRRKFFPLPSGY
ncbi:MAG: glycosyltransferase [Candidatus Amesbacteria bacterium]|nr:glycosyltransferase [Candidatus Amesbacteria bacterium]